MRICIVIIFNHRYDKNIQKLKEIYKGRFAEIRFIVPFYDGEDETVIPVYESSHQFQGYVAQAYHILKNISCDSFFFIADDMLLNPRIDETAMEELFGEGTNFISEYVPLMPTGAWTKRRLKDAWKCFDVEHTNFERELLSKEEAFRVATEKGFDSWTIKFNTSLSYLMHGVSIKEKIKKVISQIEKNGFRKMKLPYPLMGGYSDIFIITAQDLKKVCKAFGVTAAMGLFVEVAIPTCMFLYCEQLKTFESLGFQYSAIWGDKEIDEFGKKYQYSIKKLNDSFADDILYYHPVKLTRWQ